MDSQAKSIDHPKAPIVNHLTWICDTWGPDGIPPHASFQLTPQARSWLLELRDVMRSVARHPALGSGLYGIEVHSHLIVYHDHLKDMEECDSEWRLWNQRPESETTGDVPTIMITHDGFYGICQFGEDEVKTQIMSWDMVEKSGSAA